MKIFAFYTYRDLVGELLNDCYTVNGRWIKISRHSNRYPICDSVVVWIKVLNLRVDKETKLKAYLDLH